MMRLAILDGHDVVEVDDPGEWMAEWQHRFDEAQGGADPWRVALTIGDGFTASTVFLGNLDLAGRGFETYAGRHDEDDPIIIRYRTWDEAAEGHAHIVTKIAEHQETQTS